MSFVLAGFLAAGIAAPVTAQVFWKKAVSPSKIFETLMRVEKEERSVSMLVSDERAVYSEEVFANIDHRPYKNVMRRYSVSLDQTFGPGLADSEKVTLAKHAVDKILKSYDQYDHVIKYRNKDDRYGIKGEYFALIYNDPVFGPQGVRTSVFYTQVGKFVQTAIVPADMIDEGLNNEFLGSFAYEDGWPLVKKRTFESEWVLTESPHKIYLVRVPPKTDTFFDTAPEIQKMDNAEMMRFVFKDPVRMQSLFYNTYGYFSKDTLDFATVEKILGENHIRKHRREPSKVGITKGMENEIPYIEASYSIPPTKKVPYLNYVKLRAYFTAHHIFVQEVMGSQLLVETNFLYKVMSMYQFHPEKSDLQAPPEPVMPEGEVPEPKSP